MRMYDIILKKRRGQALSDEEIRAVVSGYTAGEIPDEQVSALLMAVCFQGMDERETASLTEAMLHSGDAADLSAIPGVKADKHSTGGVGDKTSLIVAPLVAACGVKVAKMSGRGLGHTGGTLDKLESIPGLSVNISRERFFEIVRDEGLAIIGQTGNIAPADKKLYALRDVTATVDSVPLIASSIMSKKLAAGSDVIVLDVKTGSGAFMQTLEGSIELAKAMVSIGERHGRRTAALVTDMDRPLGCAVGNALEVDEAVRTLRGEGPADLTSLSLELAANMLHLAGMDIGESRERVRRALEDGSGFWKLCRLAAAQGGDTRVLEDTSLLPRAPFTGEVRAPRSGRLTHMQTQEIGAVSALLGAGRARKEDAVDAGAGLVLRHKTGEYVREGEIIAKLYTSREETLAPASERLLGALEWGEAAPVLPPLIAARVTRGGVERY